MQTLLMVGVGKSGRPYLDAARRLGVRVHAVEVAERAATIEEAANEVTVCRGGSDELWAEAAITAARACQPDGVLAFSEPHVMAAALVADEFGLPGPSLRAATLSRNKALQRARFGASGIGQPEYLVTERIADAAEWAEPRMPVVLKPLSSAGSDGVELVADMAAYREAARRRDGEGRLLVERAVEGPEYSWEALVCDGNVWCANLTEKETTGPPDFVEVAHWAPADTGDTPHAVAADLGPAVLEAIGMRTGIVHLEFKLTPSGPAVMEIAVRTPGDCLMDLLGLAYGVDWFEMAIRAALGWELPEPPKAPVRFAASYLPSAPAGTVVAVEGLDDVLAQPCVVSANVTVAPGQQVSPARSSGERAGEVVLAAENPGELAVDLEQVRRLLAVVTRPADPPG
ncbi:ATP-grasp domain-containing protein [Salinactinospora qingdaonensis]|uniref:Acetyl-CoA carboxylase biotin carboxylase subunit family protein n=1 Tax=Salinactinospora qingdaonensis TaxID=702744 RepID=A0ABP7G0M0_9ACTN